MSAPAAPSSPRVVVITGGNSGIGRGVALAFATLGDRVVITGRNQETLRSTAAELGPEAIWIRSDVGKAADVRSAVDTIVKRHGRIDVLVNNAGLVARHFSTRTPFDEAERLWDEILQANLKGMFLMVMAAVPHLTRPGGRIVNMSSIAAFQGGSRVGMMAYATSKAGVNALTHALARELSPEGITVNAVAPGFIDTTGAMAATPEGQQRVAQTPVGRVGTPADIAAAVLYLASAEASFVTGEVLNVNGGKLFVH